MNSVPRDGGSSCSTVGSDSCWYVLFDTRLLRFGFSSFQSSDVVAKVSLVIGRPRCACSRCDDIGRKNPCAANDGTCDLLIRLVALPGLLPIALEAAAVLLLAGGGGPRRDMDGCDRGGCDDIPVNDCVRSPSSEVVKSVTRDDIPPTDGGLGIPNACCDGGGLVASSTSRLTEGNAAILSLNMTDKI